MKLERILVLDDESNVRGVVTDLLREMGYSALGVPSIRQARTLLQSEHFDLILSDMRLEDGDGLQFLEGLRREHPGLKSVLMTGFGTLDSAVQAMRAGIFDYLLKPIDMSRLQLMLDRLEEVSRLEAENTYLRRELVAPEGTGVEWGESEVIRKTQEMIIKISSTDATVLIQGESGTGKEVAAHAIHAGSPRAGKPFIKVNCAAIPSTLLESEFFGHEKGAFTGAVQRREGRFELADKGTLLLDEISEIPPDLQVKLLRVLQEREFERVGGNKTIKVDVRLVATTNRNLAKEVREGRFREDLFYRLNVVPVSLPPLRDRGEDIIHLARYFAAEFGKKHGKAGVRMGQNVLTKIRGYRWPGNVRELQNAIERAVILSGTNGELRPEDLPEESHLYVPTAEMQDDNLSLAVAERHLIIKSLKKHQGNRTHAAASLGISLRTLRNKLAELRREGLEL